MIEGMTYRQLPWVAAVAVAVVVGFLVGTWRAGATIQTGRADSMGGGGGSIVTTGWTYGFSSDVAWTDASGSWHDGGTPACLPPLSSRDGVRFASVDVTVDGATWRPVVWIDCRSVPGP